MKKSFKWGAFLLGASLVLSACNQGGTVTGLSEEGTAESKTSAQYPLSVKDATGKAVQFDKAPEKIISVAPSNTETLYALGVGDNVVGVTTIDDYPKEVENVEKIGDLELDVEKIIALQPDVVFAHETAMSISKSGFEQLESAGIKVFYVPEATNFEETYDVIEELGKVTNTTDKAQAIVSEMKEEVTEVQEAVINFDEKRKVFIETSDEPEIYTAGNETFMQEMLNMLNAENVADYKAGWYKISNEQIVKANPDVIIAIYSYVPNITEKIKKRDGFNTIDAVKEDRVVQVDENITSRTGPRLAEGLKEMAEAIYPEAFDEK